MICNQLVTCEECRDGRCDACRRFKRRQRAFMRKLAEKRAAR